MVASVLFQPTSVDEEYHLTTVKHVSLSSSALRFDTEDDDNDDDDDDDDDDDATIHYDNTTTAAAASTLTRQQRQQHQRVLLEEQRILQTSPSSVVPSNVPEIVLGTTFSTIHHDVTTTSNNDASFITTASIDATLPLSIPTLIKNQNCNRLFVPTVVKSTNTTVTTNASSPLSSSINPCSTTTAAIIQKPFFIMDFLEDIDPTVLALVQESLLPPTKRKQQHYLPSPIPPPTGLSQDCVSFVSKDDTFGATTSNGSRALLLHGEISNGGVDSMSNRWIQLLSEHKHTSVSTLLSLPFLQRSVEMGRQYQLRGSMAAQQGQWNRALRYWWDALEIRTQIQSSVATTNRVHDPNNMDPNMDPNTTSPLSVSLLLCSNLDVAETYHNIGIAHGKLKQYDTALYYLHQAFEIRIDSVVAATTVSWDSDGDANTFVSSSTTTTTTNTSSTTNMQQQLHIDIVSSLRSIGNMYQSQNELSLAIQYYIKCKLLQEELLPWTRATMIDMARTCITIGHSYAMGLAYADAYEAYHDAVTIFHELGLSSSTSERNIENDHYYSEYQSTVTNLRLMEQKKSF